jgi:hypothetical protein
MVLVWSSAVCKLQCNGQQRRLCWNFTSHGLEAWASAKVVKLCCLLSREYLSFLCPVFPALQV